MEYMSQEGWDKLVNELKHLESVELPACKDAISEARDKGDLSENFEYHAAKSRAACWAVSVSCRRCSRMPVSSIPIF